jgi:hypothetical protein
MPEVSFAALWHARSSAAMVIVRRSASGSGTSASVARAARADVLARHVGIGPCPQRVDAVEFPRGGSRCGPIMVSARQVMTARTRLSLSGK